MNKLIALSICCCVIAISAFAAEDYVITINGRSYDIGLDSKNEISLPNGQKLKVELKMKEEVQCVRPYFSFTHSSKYKPSSSDLGNGVFQTMLATPEGTLILIQEYSTMDPSSMIDLMLNELTKEEVDYGYKYKETSISKKIGKREANGKQAITNYKDNNWVREVCTVAGKDCGILIITQIDTVSNAKEQPLIDNFWKTLQTKKLH